MLYRVIYGAYRLKMRYRAGKGCLGVHRKMESDVFRPIMGSLVLESLPKPQKYVK